MVATHFFEPAISLVRDKYGYYEPYLGHGVADSGRKTGPLSLTLLKLSSDVGGLLDWCAIPRISNERAYTCVSHSWARVSYFMTHCVQQCLAREPFLAVFLSIASYLTRDDFQSAVSSIYQESPTQRSVGNLDGELFEYTAFAALQLACRIPGKEGETCAARLFLEILFSYLAATTTFPGEHGFEHDLIRYKARLARTCEQKCTDLAS